MNTWAYIRAILGPGLHWSRTPQDLRRAISRAEHDNRHDAAEHLRIILEMRNRVMFDDSEKTPPGEGGVNPHF